MQFNKRFNRNTSPDIDSFLNLSGKIDLIIIWFANKREAINMPNKDGAGPKGQGSKDGHGKGKGKGKGSGQGPMTGGKKGARKTTKK